MADNDVGRFVWYDLMTSDPGAAIAFYTHVVGWGTEQWSDPAMPYTMWTVDGTPIGGVMPLPPHLVEAHVPPHWLPYIGTPEVQAASLDHAVWFHRPFRADEWWLYDQVSPSASGGRGLTFARVFTQDGVLVANVAQEGLIRTAAGRA